MKILHVIQTSEGADWLYLLAREQHRRGHTVEVAVPSRTGRLVSKLEAVGIPVRIFPIQGKRIQDLPRLMAGLAKLTAFIRRERIEVVHYSLFVTTQIGRAAAAMARVPVQVSTCAGPFYLEASPYRWIERMTAFMDDKVICSCEAIRGLYLQLGVPLSRLVTVYLAMEPNRFAENGEGAKIRQEFGIPSSVPLVGIVALFYRKAALRKRYGTTGVKGHEFFLQAAAKVRQKIPQAKFLIVGDDWDGDGSYRRELEAMASDLGLGSAAIFTGYRQDVPQILSALDVAVQASLTESVGGAAEGLLAAKPMVATRVGGFPDVIHQGQTGLLVEPADPEAMANAIVHLLDHPDEARRMGQAGQALASDLFDAGKVADRVLAVYAEVLDRRRRG